MADLTNLRDALDNNNNVKMLFYDKERDQWTIYYKDNSLPDVVTSDDLISTLQND